MSLLMVGMMSSECDEFCRQEERIIILEQQVQAILTTQDKLEQTLEKLDATQDKLAIGVAELNNTFKLLKTMITLLISILVPILGFLVMELIKIIV